MKTCLMAHVIMLLAFGAMARAQEAPVATSPSFGFSLPTVEGTMTYSLSASQSFMTGYGTGTDYMTALSGDLAYVSSSPNKPFSLVYSGGYMYSVMPGYPPNSTYQNLAASQVVTTKNWTFVADDAISYMPESPTTGLSGIPGVGDIGIVPVQIGDEPARSVLTTYATQVANGLSGTALRKIGGNWSVDGSASWQILDFTGSQAQYNINSDTATASIGPAYRIDARSSASASAVYSYTNDTYQGTSFPFTTEAIMLQYQRQITQFLTVNVSVGPQRMYGTGAAELLIPAQMTVVGSAALSYTRRTTSASITFSRASNAGSGVMYGALTDTVAGVLQKQLSRNWVGALTASYSDNTALGQFAGVDDDYDATYGGGQISRKMGRAWSAYFSYTAMTQTTNAPGASQSAFSGLMQDFAIGITYAPGAFHPGRL